MNTRNGTALVTLFLILFFALLVVVGLILLTVESSASKKEDDGAIRTYADTQASIALAGLLRQPFPADLNGDGSLDASATLADALAIPETALNEQTEAELHSRLPKDTLWSLTVYRPGTSWRIDAVAQEKFPGGISAFQDVAGRASVKIANGVTVTLLLLDAGPASASQRQEADK